MARYIAHVTGETTRIRGAADWTDGFNSALATIQMMLNVNYPSEEIARRIHADIGKFHHSGNERQPGDPTIFETP